MQRVAIARALANNPEINIMIEGHTDDLQINTAEFPSNWELASKRAINVVHYFENLEGIEVKKLKCLSYGENHPLVPNNSVQNRAKNRRVEIFLEPGSETNQQITAASN